MTSSKASSISTSPEATADIALSLPRGDAVSSPVRRYVGQWGRQSPHSMQALSSSDVGAHLVDQGISAPTGNACRLRNANWSAAQRATQSS